MLQHQTGVSYRLAPCLFVYPAQMTRQACPQAVTSNYEYPCPRLVDFLGASPSEPCLSQEELLGPLVSVLGLRVLRSAQVRAYDDRA